MASDSGKKSLDFDGIYKAVKRCTFLHINMDTFTENIRIMRSFCHPNTGVMGVIKNNFYMHGGLEVAKHFKRLGIERIATATVGEAVYFRQNGIGGPLHLFGNSHPCEIDAIIEHCLIPSVTTKEFVDAWAERVNAKDALKHTVGKEDQLPGCVTIKVDSGMSRNGIQVEELPEFIDYCDKKGVKIEQLYTHFAQAWDDQEFTLQQLNTFLKAVEPYKYVWELVTSHDSWHILLAGCRNRGFKLSAANTAALMRGIATDLDFVRIGVMLAGLGQDDDKPDYATWKSLGLKPILTWYAIPTLVKELPKGRYIGYSKRYQTTSDKEIIATLCVGYADGIPWRIMNIGSVLDPLGRKCPIVGRISMDAITVRLHDMQRAHETFTVMSADYDPDTSCVGWALKTGTITWDTTHFSERLPRVYTEKGREPVIVQALTQF